MKCQVSWKFYTLLIYNLFVLLYSGVRNTSVNLHIATCVIVLLPGVAFVVDKAYNVYVSSFYLSTCSVLENVGLIMLPPTL